MKVIKPKAILEDTLDRVAILKKIERAGRTCYKSEDSVTEESASKFVRMLIRKGHESVLEHFSFSVRFICDRGVSHEFVRHRLHSFSQESTRYCNYGAGRFGEEITVIDPCFWSENREKAELWNKWFGSCLSAESDYLDLLNSGASPQEARSVLPNSLKTEMVMTGNLRSWRHFIKLRDSAAAHPQARELAKSLHSQLSEIIPEVFGEEADL